MTNEKRLNACRTIFLHSLAGPELSQKQQDMLFSKSQQAIDMAEVAGYTDAVNRALDVVKEKMVKASVDPCTVPVQLFA